jgi:hypothetical protein
MFLPSRRVSLCLSPSSRHNVHPPNSCTATPITTMPERRRRVKTGCVTCRKRRVKCDERKPTCHRCEAANISCDGYQLPRRIAPTGHVNVQPSSAESESSAYTSPATSVSTPNTESPLHAHFNNFKPSKRPHQRARDVIGHQQYSSRTVELLFRHNHLHFWRDSMLETAMDTEYVFDAVIALGIMHSAVVMSCEPNSKRRALDSKVAAFQKYADALKGLSETCRERDGQATETIIAVLLLLTYFEASGLTHSPYLIHID